MERKVICKLDGKEVLLKHLSRHLKIHHQKDYREYISENLEEFKQYGWNKCPYSGEIVKGKVSPEFTGQYIADLQRGKKRGPMSEEQKKKLSGGRKGEKHWNYGKTRDFMTDEIRQKISNSRLGNPSRFGPHKQSTKDKISKSMTGLLVGEKNPMYGKTHTEEAIRKIFAHRKMNKLEKLVADYLDDINVDYEFQYFITKDGVCKSYDFKIKGKDIIIEVDGDFWHGNPNTKSHFVDCDSVNENDRLKDKLAESRGYRVIRLWERDIKDDITIVSKRLAL